ncbi:hypothetical protein ACVPOW_11155 [Staphylococcus aureus]
MIFEDTAHTYLIQFTQGQYELTPVAFSKKVPEYLVLIGKGYFKKMMFGTVVFSVEESQYSCNNELIVMFKYK